MHPRVLKGTTKKTEARVDGDDEKNRSTHGEGSGYSVYSGYPAYSQPERLCVTCVGAPVRLSALLKSGPSHTSLVSAL